MATPSTLSGSVTSALATFNRGAALMEQYKYAEAAKAFSQALDLAPNWVAARFNLGLAYFNSHGTRGAAGKLESARKTLLTVLESDPEHRHARFCLGLYHQHLGEDTQALDCFEAVRAVDPADPFVAYKCAEALITLERHEEGTELLERVVALDPGFISGVYRLAMQYNRAGKREKAMALLKRFQELRTAELSGGSFGVQKTYGTVGKYYMALGADNFPLPPPESTAGRISFSPKTRTLDANLLAWPWHGGLVNVPGVAAGDVDGDGELDLCLSGAGPQGNTSLWLNDGSGNLAKGPELASQGVSPCFGDLDNDGDLDLWLGCAGGDLFLENDGKGSFQKAAPSVRSDDDLLTCCARLLDIDSDGDLDLLAFRLRRGSVPAKGDAAAGPSSVFNNNRDGAFPDVAEKLGLVLADTPVAAMVYDDFDNDRDLDLVIFPAAGTGPIAWVNDRAWQHRTLDVSATGLDVENALAATSGDPDRDGDRDLLIFTDGGVHLYRNLGRFRFQKDEGFADRCGRFRGTNGQFADMDNDGDLDVVIADGHRRDGTRGPVLLVNDWPRDRFLNAAEFDAGNLLAAVQTPAGAACVAADFTGDGRCDLLLAAAGQRPLLLENITPGGHWIGLDLRGTRQKDRKSRSNNSAIGARVEVKAGRVFQQFTVGVSSGPTAMAPLRIHAGLGDHSKVEWLRIVWPDAVLQAELELPADRVTTITELPRKTSSCPHLFAWDGSRFDFVADFAGVGGLGYWVASGTYAPPDPTEYIRVPQLQPRDGYYMLHAVEILEEVVYFDEAKLIAVDHPAGTEVYPHEMMAIGVPPPPREVFCFRETIDPVSAVDHRGIDVTGRLRQVDRRYAGATELDHRFTGIAQAHFVELDFGDRLSRLAPDSRLILCLHGWVEYGYSSTNFAASQAGVRARAPSIHVFRGGRWEELFHEVGYPAGLRHTMTLDVTGKLLRTDRKIRIESNMELYWDRIFLAEDLGKAAFSLKEVQAENADLHFLGYPREYSPDGHHPNLYDYANVDRTAAWKLASGDYTRFGDVTELVEAADDCYVIMGRGEELTLSFPASAFGPVAEGRRRTFLLKTDCYCKDMDLYSAYPDTVEPLPFHRMSGYPYRPDEHYPDDEKNRSYRRRYNTRHIEAQ